jgi:hypothetical protein
MSNGSRCKYVQTFTHHVGSIGALSIRTAFVRGTSTEQRGFPEMISIIISMHFSTHLKIFHSCLINK